MYIDVLLIDSVDSMKRQSTITLKKKFFIFIHNKGINIHMTYNNNENKQSEIITLSLYL